MSKPLEEPPLRTSLTLIAAAPRVCHCERSEAISCVMRYRLLRRYAPRNDGASAAATLRPSCDGLAVLHGGLGALSD